MKISAEGGAAVDLGTFLPSNTTSGGSWGADGNIIIPPNASSGLSRFPAAGGALTPVTELARREAAHKFPHILLGGKAVLFTSSASSTAFDAAGIEVVTLADHHRKILQRGGTAGRFVPAANGMGTSSTSAKGRFLPSRSIRTGWRCAAPPRLYWKVLPTVPQPARHSSTSREAEP